MKDKFFALNKENNKIICEILATFFINKKNYLFYKDDQENIYAGYIENKEIKQIINEKEFEQIEEIYNELKGMNRKIKFTELTTQYYKGTIYKTIYDNKENKCFTFELKNKRFKEVDGDVKEYFDFIYNENINILYSNNQDEKFKNYNKLVKKIIKVQGVFLAVIIFNNAVFETLKYIDLNKGFIQNINSIVEMHQIDENDAKFVMSYIKNNDKIAESDKQFFLKQEHFFKENEQYFDMASIKKNLMNLEIIFDKDNYKKYVSSDKIRGFYNNNDDKIVILCSDGNYDNDFFSQQVLFHEMMHAISNSGYLSDGSLGLCLTEGLTELITEEYLDTYSNTYNKNQTYARIMCELIGTDVVRESFLKGNLDMLIDALCELYGNKDDAIRFISLIDTEANADTTILKNLNQQEVDDAKKTLSLIQPDIDRYLKLYYEAKFKTPIENDDLMKAYYDSIRLTNTLNNENYEKGNMWKINVVKNYFNSKLKKDKVIIEYYYLDENIITIDRLKINEINEENTYRYLSGNGYFNNENQEITYYKKIRI